MPGHFDPEVLAAFARLRETFRGIYDRAEEAAQSPQLGASPWAASPPA